jgi:ribonuclease HI
LKTYCTNNQAEYEALLFGLELLNCMGVKHVKAFGDSQIGRPTGVRRISMF